MESNPDFVAVKIDLENAYNKAERAVILKSLLKNPATRNWAPYFHASMSPKAKIFGIQAKSESGVQQGAPDATFEFTQVIYEDIVTLYKTVMAVGDEVCFGMLLQ